MRILLSAILFLTASFCIAQQNSTTDSKIGLVLSGGGAKGLAHIGVLKVIDSLGIKIDYVGGTSMGAIIGSLYASGYSGKELDSIFSSIDFDELINDELPRRTKSFFERKGDSRYAVTLPVKNGKVALPSALSKGHNTFNLLSKLMLHVSDVSDFKKLPIPFFCMATDVETGESVILDSGNLPEAVSASGAFPSLFQPVIIKDRVLVDGGVTNNYPIEELRKRGAEIVIGVDVQDSLMNRTQLNSAPKILLQINNYRTIGDMVKKRKLTDVYIKPNVSGFTVVSFDKGEELILNGKAAALAELNNLKTYENLVVNKRPRIEQSPDSIKVNTVYTEGNKRFTRSYILGKLKLRPGEKTSYKRFTQGLNSIITTGNFDDFTYSLKETEASDGYDLYTSFVENETKMFVKVGVHYDDLYKSAILLNGTYKGLLFKNDITSLDFVIGDKIRYNFDYFIDKGFHVSIGVSSRYNSFEQRTSPYLFLSPSVIEPLNVNNVVIEHSDFTNTVFLQTLFLKDFSLRFGAEYKRLNITSETVFDNSDKDQTIFDKSNYYGVFGSLKFDTYDNALFPTKGLYFKGDFHWYLDSSDFSGLYEDFSVTSAQIGFAQQIVSGLTLHLGTQGGFHIGENNAPFLNFILGGYGNNLVNNIHSFFGYDYLSLSGNSYVKADAKLDYNFLKNHHLNFTANVANVDENLFESGDWLSSPEYTGYALGYSFETFLGPLEVKYSWSPEASQHFWHFNLGFWF